MRLLNRFARPVAAAPPPQCCSHGEGRLPLHSFQFLQQSINDERKQCHFENVQESPSSRPVLCASGRRAHARCHPFSPPLSCTGRPHCSTRPVRYLSQTYTGRNYCLKHDSPALQRAWRELSPSTAALLARECDIACASVDFPLVTVILGCSALLGGKSQKSRTKPAQLINTLTGCNFASVLKG